jgi:hypothetical protein
MIPARQDKWQQPIVPASSSIRPVVRLGTEHRWMDGDGRQVDHYCTR